MQGFGDVPDIAEILFQRIEFMAWKRQQILTILFRPFAERQIALDKLFPGIAEVLSSIGPLSFRE